MTGYKHVRMIVALAALAGTLAGAPVAIAQDTAPQTPPSQVPFGVVSAVRGEAARLSLANISLVPPDPYLPPDPYVAPTCRATIRFVDGNGSTLRRPDGTPVSRTVELQAGHSASVQFFIGNFLGPNEQQLTFRPVVVMVPPDPFVPPDPYDSCVPTFQIFSPDTGQARLVTGGMVAAKAPLTVASPTR